MRRVKSSLIWRCTVWVGNCVRIIRVNTVDRHEQLFIQNKTYKTNAKTFWPQIVFIKHNAKCTGHQIVSVCITEAVISRCSSVLHESRPRHTKGAALVCTPRGKAQFNPSPAEPGYILPLQTVYIRISWLLNWSGSALFAIKYLTLYQQSGSSNLIGWKLEMGVAS